MKSYPNTFIYFLSLILLTCGFVNVAHATNCIKAAELTDEAIKYSITDLDHALKLIDEAMSLCEESASIRYNRAMIYYNQGRFKEAVQELKSTINIDRDYAKAHHAIAVICFDNLKDYDCAEQYANQAVALNKGNDKYNNTLQRILYEREPALLSIEEIKTSTNVLDALKSIEISITIKNSGTTDAKKAYVELSGNLQGLKFKRITPIERPITKKGGVETVTVRVQGDLELPTSRADVEIRVVEPLSKQIIKGKMLSIPTREFKKPQLILAKFAALEADSAYKNGQLDVNDLIEATFAIQNIGRGPAENISVKVENTQQGVIWMGCVESNMKRLHPIIDVLQPGEYKLVTYRYFINSEFVDKELKFNISVDEQMKRYGFSDTKIASINTEIREEGTIRQVSIQDITPGELIIEDIPDIAVDIEQNLPTTTTKNENAVAVVIGNRDYKKAKKVDYAVNDARAIKQYLTKVMGFSEGNIIYLNNASKAEFETIFGNSENYEGRLFNAIKPGASDVFVYYAGHGAPGLKDKRGYFVPVDADPQSIEFSGYSLDVLYNNLSKINAKSISVLIDACFSGVDIHENISPLVLEIQNPVIKFKDGFVLSSSRSKQPSTWYNEKKHGMFTYYFLKSIHNKNADANKDGKLTIDEIYRYIADKSNGIPYQARKHHNIDQNPTLEGPSKNKVLVEYK